MRYLMNSNTFMYKFTATVLILAYTNQALTYNFTFFRFIVVNSWSIKHHDAKLS
jgi:hypothetical protein